MEPRLFACARGPRFRAARAHAAPIREPVFGTRPEGSATVLLTEESQNRSDLRAGSAARRIEGAVSHAGDQPLIRRPAKGDGRIGGNGAPVRKGRQTVFAPLYCLSDRRDLSLMQTEKIIKTCTF